MGTLVLQGNDIAEIVRRVGRDKLMDSMITRLSAGFESLGRREIGSPPQRDGFQRGSELGVIEWMPYHDVGRSVTIKTVSYTPANFELHNLPTILGTIARFDDETGSLTAISDGVIATAIRTGAASAVASRLLASPHSSTVGLVGVGAQAVTQLHALSRTFDISKVLISDKELENARSFRQRVRFLGLDIKIASPAEIAESADIICTATTIGVGGGPVIPDIPMLEHVHINAVGADLPGKTELPIKLLERSLVCPDHLEQALQEGECQQLKRDAIGPDLPTLCATPLLAEQARYRSTVFDSTGTAIEDHIAFDLLLEFAKEHGLGTVLDIEYHPMDVLDPYSSCAQIDQLESIQLTKRSAS